MLCGVGVGGGRKGKSDSLGDEALLLLKDQLHVVPELFASKQLRVSRGRHEPNARGGEVCNQKHLDFRGQDVCRTTAGGAAHMAAWKSAPGQSTGQPCSGGQEDRSLRSAFHIPRVLFRRTVL